jgi:hypothetical protein
MFYLTKQKYQKIYSLLNVNPTIEDCGELCGKACCRTNDKNMGIYLLPNEDKLFTGSEEWLTWEEHDARDFDFPSSWQGKVYFIHCRGTCPREKRPIQCRTFPLAPHIDNKNVFHIIWETLELPYECPLIKNKIDLNPRFIKSTYFAWKYLIKNKLIRDLVKYDSNKRIIENKDIISLYTN